MNISQPKLRIEKFDDDDDNDDNNNNNNNKYLRHDIVRVLFECSELLTTRQGKNKKSQHCYHYSICT